MAESDCPDLLGCGCGIIVVSVVIAFLILCCGTGWHIIKWAIDTAF